MMIIQKMNSPKNVEEKIDFFLLSSFLKPSDTVYDLK